jgi:hypothetical protein
MKEVTKKKDSGKESGNKGLWDKKYELGSLAKNDCVKVDR